MASDNEASCESDPNFAVICAFMEKFGSVCGLASIDFLELQEMLENTQEVPQELIDLHIKLLRKSRKTVSNERWEKAIIKICHGFCIQDAWEIERFGYKKARLSSKLRVLKELLEMQFDYNAKFKTEINKMSAEELRSQPLGKDKQGHAYWFQNDNNCQIRVYKEDPDEETWTLVAKDREGLVSLISELSNGDSTAIPEAVINEEDSNSLVEKPIIDTGQVDSSSSSDSNKKSLSESDNSNESKKDESDVSESTKKEDISRPDAMDENARMDEEPKPELSKRRGSDVEGAEAKRAKLEVSEAIEEPLMLVKGEGSGEDNECVNPIIGEEIEEDLMYFYGCGNGEDCQTGNEDKETKKSDNNSECEKSTSRDASDSDSCVSISVNKSDSKNCINDGSSKEVPTSPHVKSSYKLGTIIDTKTDNKFFNTIRSPTKKSRWDVETIIAKEPPPEAAENDVTSPKKSMFFFGPGCMQFKTNLSPVACGATVAFGQKVPLMMIDEKFEASKSEARCANEGRDVIPANTKGDIGYRIICEKEESTVTEASECVQSDQETPIESFVDAKLDQVTKNEETKASAAESVDRKHEVLPKSEENEDTATKSDSEKVADTNKDASVKSEDALIEGEGKTTEKEESAIKCEAVPMESEEVPTTIENATSKSDTPHESEEVLTQNEEVSVKSDVPNESQETAMQSEQVSITNENVAVKSDEPNESEEVLTKNEDTTGKSVVPLESEHVPTTNEDATVISGSIPNESEDVSTENEDPTIKSDSISNGSEEVSTQNDDNNVKSDVLNESEEVSTENKDPIVKSDSIPKENEEVSTENEDATVKREDSPVASEEIPTENRDSVVTIREDVPTEEEEISIENEDSEATKNEENEDSQIVKVEETPIEIEDTVNKIEDAPIQVENEDSAATKSDDGPIEIEDTNSKREDGPIEIEDPNSKSEDAPIEVENEDTAPTKSEDGPIEIEDTNSKREDAPIEVENEDSAPTKNEESPIEIEDTNSKSEDAPIEVQNEDSAPTKNEDNPIGIEETNSKSEDAPIEVQNEDSAPTKNEDNPIEIEETNSKIEDAPIEVENEDKSEAGPIAIEETNGNRDGISKSEDISIESEEISAERDVVATATAEDAPNKIEETPSKNKDAPLPEEVSTKPEEETKNEDRAHIEDELAKQIVGEESEIAVPQSEDVPTVTAALLECETKNTNEESKQSAASAKKPEEPVIEETCVRKEAYLLGKEENAKISNHETNDNQPPPATKNKSRKNNIADEPPRTRRTTRSSKNEEAAAAKMTETSDLATVKKEKSPPVLKGRKEKSPPVLKEKKDESPPVPKDKKEKSPPVLNKDKKEKSPPVVKDKKEKSPPVLKDEPQAPLRRGRSRGMAKTEIEASERKKTKMSSGKKEESAAREKKEEAAAAAAESSPPLLIEAITVETSNDSDLMELPDRDPLAVSEEETKENEEKAPMALANFSLDFNESPTPTPPLTRSGLRKRGRESPQNLEEIEASAGKRMKKAKRNVDTKLRKSIEEQKKQELISSDDDNKDETEQNQEKSSKKKGSKHKKTEKVKIEETTVISSDPETETKKEPEPKPKKHKTHKDKRLRLFESLGIDPDQAEALNFGEEGQGRVRQSRRIAQLKIKEEAERRKLEEEMTHEHKKKKKKSKKSDDKDYKVEKKKAKNEDDGDETVEEDSADSKKKKKKKKKKKHKKLFDEFNPWRSSSDSSTTDEEDEEEMPEEEEDEELQYVSDHEFSPESDLEGDGEALPLKRARTARKESDVEEVDDCPCQKCGKSDHPEWILLCDRCDNGWHCSCLRPPLLVIPEGDWFCPPCQHVTLLKKLQEKLQEYDAKLSKKEIEDRRKQRLAYVGISLNSVLPAKETETAKKRRREPRGEGEEDEDDAEVEEDEEDDESSSGDEESGSGSSESGSDSDEPIYQLRQRRQAHSYRFNDYDELINSAIQDEMEAVKGAGNQGRGKDISTIVNAEKEEMRKDAEPPAGEEVPLEPEPLPPVVPLDEKDKEPKPVYSDDEPIKGVRKKIIGRKKHRKLNSLDISSEDDNEDSDEDFKGTSSESDDDFEEDLGSEDSDDLDGGRNRKKGNDPVRRSTRARTSRYDADFIDDGDSDDEDEAPRRKKKRSIWDDSESEESDRSWGRRKRKPASKQKKSSSGASKKKKTKKKKKDNDDSDAEVYRKKKPKIKFGLDGDDDGPVRRTRGKKINYVDALGSDSDEDRVKRPPPRIESEEEYVANEEDFDEDDKGTDEEEAESAEDKSKAPKVQIQSYADARFTQLLPEGVPTPKDLYSKNPILEDGDSELNPIDQINRNVEMMDENEMEKMMEDEEYANKHLQMVALQLEKEKRRKEREAKAKLEGLIPPQMPPQDVNSAKKRGRKPKNQFFGGAIQEPIVGNVDNLIVNPENNDELSEPPGVSLPLFADLGGPNDGLEDPSKKRRGRSKKSLEEAVANLGSARQQESATFPGLPPNQKLPTDLSVQESNIEIAAPPQPFSQSQPTPSVITRMLQSKPGQPGYPIGAIRPKQFATMPEREEDVPTSLTMSPAPPAHHGQYIQGPGLRPQLSSPYRQMPPMNHYPRGTAPPPPPHQIRNPVPHIYHSHRPMDPSPSGGGTITMPEHNSPGRVVSPAAGSPGSNKNETPPPPYSRPPPVGRFPPMVSTTAGPRHIPMVAPHMQPPRPNLSPYHPSMPPAYHYGQFGQLGEDALPPTVYQNSPYSEQFSEGQPGQENSNSKSFDEESGGEFGGLVSYFSSQREDDLES